MIELEVNGDVFTNFTKANIDIRLDQLSNTFDLEATTKNNNPLPFKGGEGCKIFVDGEVVLTGSIEIVDVSYSSNAHSIRVAGRDKTGDLVDSTLDSISDLNSPISLKQIIEKVLSEIGLNITVIDNVTPELFEKAEDIIAPEPGDSAFQFLEKYARKRQSLLTSNEDGNIVISQSSGVSVNAKLRNKINNNSNNILQGSVSYDTTGRYNVYKFTSGMNAVALNAAGDVPLSDVVSQSGNTIDPDIRTGRQFVLNSEDSGSNEQNKLRAEWEANIRKSRGRVGTVAVQGFRNQTGSLWTVNSVVSIVDDFLGIDAKMLINSVNFSYSTESGSISRLQLVESNAYTLSLNDPKNQDLGDEFFA